MTNDLYTRGAIVQWVNDCLSTSYTSFAQIPAKQIARLLHAIFRKRPHASSSSSSLPQSSSASDSLCPLHEILFDDEAPTAALRNRHTVVALAKQAGFTGKLDPIKWHDGNDFVNELLFWRWLRGEAASSSTGGDGDGSSWLVAALAVSSNDPHTSVAAAAVPVPSHGHPHLQNKNSDVTASSAKDPLPSTLSIPTLPAQKKRPREPQQQPQHDDDDLDKVADRSWVCHDAQRAVTAASSPSTIFDRAASTASVLEQHSHAASVCVSSSSSSSSSSSCVQCGRVTQQLLHNVLESVKRLESLRASAVAACAEKNMEQLLQVLSQV